jgi:hypothetical protein
MKKIVLSIAGSFLLCTGIVQAQQDTTRTNNRTQQRPVTQQPQPVPQPQPQVQQQQNPQQPNQYLRDDMRVLKQDQLPESLRQTLRGTEYKGWEQSTIYQDPTTGEYLLEMNTPIVTPNNTNPSPATSQDQSGNNSPRTYRFDRNGRVIENKNKPGDNDNK